MLPAVSATDHRRVVVVVGPGRSGTSTMAGALSLMGHHVPDAIAPDASNPRGFFEPRWVVDLHTELLSRVGVRTLDTDPEALERMADVTGDEAVRTQVRDWLAAALAQSDRVVVKDPRIVWFTDLWAGVAEDLGCEPGFVVMLRHPAEVSSSRNEYYDIREVTAVAGWVNVALVTEQLTAGRPRVFVRYPALNADWRTQLGRVRDALGVHLDPAPDHEPHPVDDFIDPGLRRMRQGWDDLSVPAHLQEVAEPVHDALGALAGDADPATVLPRLDELRSAYARIHEDALAVVRPRMSRRIDEASRKAARRARRKAKEEGA